MKWIDDWPVIGDDRDGDGCGEPVSTYRKPNVGKHIRYVHLRKVMNLMIMYLALSGSGKQTLMKSGFIVQGKRAFFDYTHIR